MRKNWKIVPVLCLLALALQCGDGQRGIVLESASVIDDPELAHPETIGKVRPGEEVTVTDSREIGGEKLVQIKMSGDTKGWIPDSAIQISDKKGKLAVPGFAIIPTVAYDKPGTEDRKAVARLARGESFRLIREKEVDGKKYSQVGIAGLDEVAWVPSGDIFIGEKIILTALNETKIYDRPDRNRRTVGTLPVGKKGYQVDEEGDFVKFNIWKGQEHWVLRETVGQGDVKVQPEVAIQGFGTATLDATSWVDSDVVGREHVYSPEQAFDGSFSTSWQTSKNGGVGESMTITFDRTYDYVNVELVNGFAKSEELYNQNNRITNVNLVCFNPHDSTSGSANLEDNIMDYQHVGSCNGVSAIRLEVTGVSKGSKWEDAAISEIRLSSGP